MAPAIIAAIISAAASKVKSNQDNAAKMNEGQKTGGSYQIGTSENPGVSGYQPSSQSINTGGGGGSQLAESIIKQYMSKKGTEEAAQEAAQQATQETAENIAENIH